MKRFRSFWWKFFLLLALLGIMFSYAMFQGGFVSWFLFFSFVPIFLYAFLFAFYPLSDFTVERTLLREELKAGDTLEGTIRMKRSMRFPLFFVIIEEQYASKNNNSVKTILFPWFKKDILFHYSVPNLPRGELCLQGIRIKTGDLLGLVEKERFIPLEKKVLVFPKVVEMSRVRKEETSSNGSFSNRKPFQKDTSMAGSVRDYEAGDKLSWIDWKATARRSQLMTKEFDPTFRKGYVLYMDEQASSNFEQMITFVASYIHALLKSGAELTFYAINNERTRFPAESSERQLQKIFLYLAKVHEKLEVNYSLVRPKHDRKEESTVIITSSVSSGLLQWIEQMHAHQKQAVELVIVGEANGLKVEEIMRAWGIRVMIVTEELFPQWS